MINWLKELFGYGQKITKEEIEKETIEESMEEPQEEPVETVEIQVEGFYRLEYIYKEEPENNDTWIPRHFRPIYDHKIVLSPNLTAVVKFDGEEYWIPVKANEDLVVIHSCIREESVLREFLRVSEDVKERAIMEKLKEKIRLDVKKYFSDMDVEKMKDILNSNKEIDVKFTFEVEKRDIV